MFEEVVQKIAEENQKNDSILDNQPNANQPIVNNTNTNDNVEVNPNTETGGDNKTKEKTGYIDKTIPLDKDNPKEDVVVEWYDETTNDKQDKTGKNINKDSAELERKLTEYEELFKDDDIKFIIEAKKNGKSIYDIAKEVQFEDVDKKSDREIFIESLKSEGLTDEQIENDLEKFDNKTTYEQKQLTKPIRESFKAEQTNKLAKFTKGLTESSLKQNENIQKTQIAGLEEYDVLKHKFTGKHYAGLEITEDRANIIENQLLNNVNANADGTFDLRISNISDAYDFLVWKNFKKELVKSNISKAKSDGAESVLKERIRPSANNTGTTNISKTQDEELSDAVNEFITKSNY